ncbi:MAG TPA: aminotransferase class I/II-fold pyridoxal phosphate-dependent enzyme [Planctomycetota bacterium]|nr:aminotransferase class I/II-fold pyridoxal phosphate-dependent enzyme [Planctomycetota bacterium]
MKPQHPGKARFATRCVHGSGGPDSATGAISPPIYQTSTFAFPDMATAAARFSGADPGYVYSRLRNPTTDGFEREMASLEGGGDAVALGSGMAAVAMTLLSYLRPGDQILASRTLYGGTHALFEGHFKDMGIAAAYVDARDPERFAAAVDEHTKVIYTETPANPNLCVVDLRAVAAVARDHRLPLVVDNTFATPYFQRPLELGAEVVVHSATKYIGGHGDALGGVVVGAKERMAAVRKTGVKEMGAVMSPFTAWLLLRGLKTLPVRMDRHALNALATARFLEGHSKVARVLYPGLGSHPQHAVARAQMSGFGGVLSFELKGGRPAGEKFIDALGMIAIAVSLGDCDTLIEHPASMTHRSYGADELAALGISQGLIRLSVGLEDSEDLIADLEQALERI